jgi:hypothetical protein
MMLIIAWLRPNLLEPSVLASACVVLLVWMALPDHVRDQTKKSRKILTSNQIGLLQELPDDNKACRMAINQGKFLDEKSALGRAVNELVDKIKSHTALGA